MVSKEEKKYIRSLQRKKYRQQYKAFVCEGTKIVKELINEKASVQKILATEQWQEEQESILSQAPYPVKTVTEKTLQQLSSLATSNHVLAVVAMANKQEPPTPTEGTLSLALENIQDPGNLGTIIRTADWFGITTIYSSTTTVDQYNPKVIQSSMGSFLRITHYYCNLSDVLAQSTSPVIAASMQGQNLFTTPSPSAGGVLLVGNESHGLSEEVLGLAHHQVHIPSRGHAESLNAAVAASILMTWARWQ